MMKDQQQREREKVINDKGHYMENKCMFLSLEFSVEGTKREKVINDKGHYMENKEKG